MFRHNLKQNKERSPKKQSFKKKKGNGVPTWHKQENSKILYNLNTETFAGVTTFTVLTFE